MLNAMVADAAAREMPGLAALAEIRKGQRYGYRTAAIEAVRARRRD